MVRLNIVCSLILTSFVGISSCQWFGSLGQYNVYRRQLEEYIKNQTLSHALKDEVEWLDQKLDHFNPANTETWKQRYAVNTADYKGDGAVFLMIEGETESMSPAVFKYSAMADFGKKHGAAMFVLEHRFYGHSQPKPDWSVDSLKYLSSEQALADLAYFITRMNVEHGFSNPKWIVFGGSYAGMLAAWLRYKYPHLVHAAVSSSAPIKAQLDYPEFLEVVANGFAGESQQCVDAIRAANQEMSKGVSDVIKRGEYRELFRLCEPLQDNENDIASFFLGIANPFVRAINYGARMDDLCNMMTDSQIKCPVKRYAKLFKEETTWFGEECFDHGYDSGIEWLQNTAIEKRSVMRQWYYQTCTEFGFYQTSSRKDSVFGDKLSLKMFTDTCTDAYGPRFNASFVDRSIAETNMNYGALSPEVDRVVFVHGSLDPWSALGIKSNPPQGSYSIFIYGTSHCADMGPESEYDKPQLAKAKSQISELIGDWLKGKTRWSRHRSVFRF